MFEIFVVVVLFGLMIASLYKFNRIIRIEKSLEILATIKKNTESIQTLRDRLDTIQSKMEERGML